MLRYVERNALQANLVERVQDWRWCGLWRRLNGDEQSLLSAWPIDVPADWVAQVNGAQSAAEVESLRPSVNRGTPYGSPDWQMRMAKKLGLEFSLPPRGRPRKGLRPLFRLSVSKPYLLRMRHGRYTISDVYLLPEVSMQVAKWGNSLAVRLPAIVVEALDLKEGDNIEIEVAGTRRFEIKKAPGARELLARLRKYRGRLPADFRFDRIEANARR